MSTLTAKQVIDQYGVPVVEHCLHHCGFAKTRKGNRYYLFVFDKIRTQASVARGEPEVWISYVTTELPAGFEWNDSICGKDLFMALALVDMLRADHFINQLGQKRRALVARQVTVNRQQKEIERLASQLNTVIYQTLAAILPAIGYVSRMLPKFTMSSRFNKHGVTLEILVKLPYQEPKFSSPEVEKAILSDLQPGLHQLMQTVMAAAGFTSASQPTLHFPANDRFTIAISSRDPSRVSDEFALLLDLDKFYEDIAPSIENRAAFNLLDQGGYEQMRKNDDAFMYN